MKRQSKLIVQGFPGSFHDEAARKYFGSRRIEVLPAKSFNDLALRLSSDDSINYGVMAIENSIAGSILQNYRILRENDFWISGETDTALVAQQIKENKLKGVAAIGSKLAAEIYGLEIIAAGIETSNVNYTRFIIISREGEYTSLGNADKASIYLTSQYENCLEELKEVSHGLDELGIYKKATIYDHQPVS